MINITQIDMATITCDDKIKYIMNETLKIESGQTKSFIISDPLYIQSIVSKLSDSDKLYVSFKLHEKGWEIFVSKAEAKNFSLWGKTIDE